jgi:hypothetical protein
MGPNFHLEQTPDAKNAYRFQPVLWIQQSLHHDIIKRNSCQKQQPRQKNSTNQSHREQKNIKRKKAERELVSRSATQKVSTGINHKPGRCSKA